VRLSDVTDTATAALREAGGRIADLMTPTVRLGVTGLARAGKTVFITSLIRNLAAGARLPFLSAMAEGRISRAFLEPQPDDRVARFAYEEHLSDLARDPPQWPESTRAVSQLRLTVEYSSASTVWRVLTPGRLHIDIVDYPGEWLLDLPLMDLDFSRWSAEALTAGRARGGQPAARAWLDFVAAIDPAGPAEETRAIEGAKLFTLYLQEARAAEAAQAVPLIAPGPGRFLLPGDLAGSPLLTFFPLPPSKAGTYPRGSLGAMLVRRFDSYKTHVVEPFFRDHFARLDRQIVLVDALSAVNAGPQALRDLERTLTAVLACFKPGASAWLSRLFLRRIDRILIAATKADHLHHTSHDRLEAILRLLTDHAIARAEYAGAEVKVMALAAIRATREAEARTGGGLGGLMARERLPCIVGVPLPGERVGSKVFDGKSEAAVFPGDLPEDPRSLLDATAGGAYTAGTELVRFPRFRPPRLDLSSDGASAVPPHIRLDRAIEFLMGDKLA
jgi:predicted YcjX-like family ATPase